MKTIAVLGAGLGGALVIRQVMRSTVLPSDEYKMVVIAPNTHFHWPIAMPRAIVPGQFADDKVMHDYGPIFKQYPAEKFELVLGTATSLDPSAKTVTATLVQGGETRQVTYDVLVVATGSTTTDDMPWKIMGTIEKTKQKLRTVQTEIEQAKTIVVAGGGLTGTETAAELGFEYSKDGKKEVIFVHTDALPLSPPLMDSVRKQAKLELEKLNVKIIADSSVTNVTKSGTDSLIEIRSSDGKTQTLTAQAYVPAFGLKPNTEFAPSILLDDARKFKQSKTLQSVDHPEIFIVGDAGNLQTAKAQNAEMQAAHLIKTLPLYLKADKIPDYVPGKEATGITLGRSRATGQIGGFKLFSIMIWWFKGRTMGTDVVPTYAAGTKTMSATYEK